MPSKAGSSNCDFLAGLTIEQTAEVIGVSHATVEREWKLAKAWLKPRANQSMNHSS